MKEIIKEIKQVTTSSNFGRKYNTELTGYEVLTNKRKIQLLISNDQDCCEDWGFCISEDNPEDFIGAELFKVEKVDDKYSKTAIDEYISDTSCVFLNFETSKGLFQLTVYNEHNGYYGHDVLIVNGENEEKTFR